MLEITKSIHRTGWGSRYLRNQQCREKLMLLG